jgi:hypothetical protein
VKTPRARLRESVEIAPRSVIGTPLVIQQPVGSVYEGTPPFQIFSETGETIHEVDYIGEITVRTDGAALFAEQLTGSANTSLDPGTISIAATSGTPPWPLTVLDADVSELTFLVSREGVVTLAAHAAPTDGNLNAGWLSFWFDQTNGAAKLMVKAKQADGTVVTGLLPLGVTTQTYTESNVTTDRTYDANSTTIDELADVLGSLIADLRAKGLVA